MVWLIGPDPLVEEPIGSWLRRLGALLMLAAGILHLAQIGVHVEEGWHVAGFFATVGAAQVVGGLWLLPRRRARWVWIGSIGSALVIAVWIVSRTSGVPFVEGGKPEPVGIADAFASLLEALTIVALSVQLRAGRLPPSGALRIIGAAASLALATAWQVAAARGAFDADDARLALDLPQLLDWIVLAVGLGVAATVVMAGSVSPGTARAGLQHGLLAAVGGLVATGVLLTLPPTIGQNLDCAYAPIATVTGIGHAAEAAPVALTPGETRLLPVFELRACGPQRVDLLNAEPLTATGSAAQIVGFWLLPPGIEIEETDGALPPSDARPVPPATELEPGDRWQLAVEMRGIRDASLQLASVRLTYQTAAGEASFGFATTVSVCSGSGCEDAPPG